MKNPYGVEPTRFMKRKGSEWAVYYHYIYGIIFDYDIFILFGNCLNRSYIKTDCFGGNEYHPEYRSSLFVNTAGPNEKNYFSVLDYEVYTH